MAARDRDDDDRDDREDHRNDGRKKHTAKMPDRKHALFRDDQFIMVATHEKAQVTGRQLRAFASAVDSALKPLGRARLRQLPEVISFPSLTRQETEQCEGLLSHEEEELNKTKKELSQEEAELNNTKKALSVDIAQRAFSLITCDLKNTPEDPAELLRIVNGLNEQLSADAQYPRAPKPSIAGLTVYGITPNWLSCVAAESGGTGGPGGKPTPYTGNRKQAPYCLNIQQQLENAQGGTIYGDGTGRHVAVLDTAPSAQALVSAYKEWPDHPIIKTLLGPKGKLHLYPATYDELLRLRCTSLNDHDYKMTDHGLFIAGIIHSIVPEAEIHLVEVLNQYGVGDLESFIRGLEIVYEQIYLRYGALPINCSWYLTCLLDERHCRLSDCVDEADYKFVQAVLEFSKNDRYTEVFLDFLFDRFYNLGSHAIAAAGNDGRKDEERVAARYPAADKSSTGVGALPKNLRRSGDARNNFVPADFSNLSESPDSRGVVTRGVVTLGGEEGEGKGVLGLYIGEFPDCCRNESKWAWWAGTSFATPILTGAVASVMSRPGNQVTTTQQAIERLYEPGAKIILDGQAGRQEDALPVKQG